MLSYYILIMTKPILLTDAKKYYKELPHQQKAVEYLGNLLLKTPAKLRLGLEAIEDWIHLEDSALQWLQRQISKSTLETFAILYRGEVQSNYKKQIEYYSQLDNKILPYTSCNSSSHAMFVNNVLLKLDMPGLGGDDEYVKRVYSGVYGTYGRNNSVSWDIQQKVVRSFGIKSKYISGDRSGLIKQVTESNIITPTNFAHKGDMRKPYGGHVVCVAQYDSKKGFLIYDPYGTRMPDYKDQTKDGGIYWMSSKEFNARWQGIWTKYLGIAR